MCTKNHQFCVCALLMVIVSACALGQQPTQKKGESTRYRKIGTLAGLGGGFALGAFVGFAVFDDATNSSRKITITALASAAGGAVGGYLLGWGIDKRKSQVTWMWMPDELDRSLMRARSLAYGWQTALLPSQVGKFELGQELPLTRPKPHEAKATSSSTGLKNSNAWCLPTETKGGDDETSDT